MRTPLSRISNWATETESPGTRGGNFFLTSLQRNGKTFQIEQTVINGYLQETSRAISFLPGDQDSTSTWTSKSQAFQEGKMPSLTLSISPQVGGGNLVHSDIPFWLSGPRDCCEVGQRIPAIYLDTKRRLVIAMGIGGEGNRLVKIPKYKLRTRKYYKLKITQDTEAEKVMWPEIFN